MTDKCLTFVNKKFRVKPPVGSVYNYYIWHVDNKDEVLEGAKPKLIQKGPYCYESRNEKVNITHTDKTGNAVNHDT